MTDELVEKVAFALWNADALRAAPNVAKQRTIEAFREEVNDFHRPRWEYLARAAIPISWNDGYNQAIADAVKVADYESALWVTRDKIRALAKP